MKDDNVMSFPVLTEPSTTTIADLVALVAGVALAAALEWYSGWSSQLGMGASPAPQWYVLLSYLNEGVRKGFVAMIPVVVARRIRYGGPVRPAEFLALCFGASRLVLSFERIPSLGLVVRSPGKQLSYTINIELYNCWMLTQISICALAVGLAAMFRRRLVPWQTCCLLVGAYLALDPIEWFVHTGRDAILDRVQLPSWAVRVGNDLLTMPFLILGAVPMVLAILDRIRRNREKWTWLEHVCLGLTLASFVGIRLKYYGKMGMSMNGSEAIEMIAINAAEIVAALSICLIIVRRYRFRIGRWFLLIH